MGENAAGAFGLFEINSKNFEIKDDVGLVVKDSNGKYAGGISNSGEIGGQGLTVITPGATTQIKVDSENIYFQGNKEKNGIKYGTDFIQDGTAIISQAAQKDTSSGNGFKSSLAVNSDDVILKSESSKDGVISNAATISLRGETGNILMTSDNDIKIESENGTTFKNPNNNDATLINGGTVTADEDVELSDGTSLKEIGSATSGISRDNEITTIEGNKLSASGIESIGDVTSKDGNTTYSLNTIGANTQAINYVNIDGKDFTTFDSGIKVANDKGEYVFSVDQNGTVISKDDVKATATNGTVYSLKNIGANTAGIVRDENGTTIEGTTTFDSNGVTVGDLAKDGSSTGISAGQATFNKTDANGNYTYTQVDGGTITASEDIGLTDGTSLKDLSTNVGEINKNTAGIERKEVTTIDGTTGYATTIEGKTVIGSDGSFSTAGGKFTVEKDGRVSVNGSVNASGDVVTWDGNNQKYSLNTIGDKTEGIERKEVTTIDGTTGYATTIEGKTVIGSDGSFSTAGGKFTVEKDGRVSVNGSVNASGDVVTWDGNNQKYSLNTIGETVDGLYGEAGDITELQEKTAGIQRDPSINNEFTTSIETTFRVHSSEGYNVGTIDVYGSMIQSKGANGQITTINGGSIITNELTVGGVSFGELVNRVDALEDKTQNITSSKPGTGEGGSVVPPTTDGQTGINGDVTVGGDLSVGGNLKADSGTIGGVTMDEGKITTGNTTIDGTGVTTDKVTVGKAEEGQSYTSITKDDVKVTDSQGNTTSLTDVGNRVTGLESSMNSMNNRINDVEDRIDKVGAMAAAIANLRTMGFDPEAPTEIAIGVGQYKSETGLALGVFHYPNQDFMLSASISTSGDEVMGGIGATWKLGRKSAAEKAKDEEAKRLEKAEDMKKLAQEEKVKAQAERHAKLLAEREAQETA